MRLADWIEHLDGLDLAPEREGCQPGGELRAKGAADLAAAQADQQCDTAYVMYLAETPGPNRLGERAQVMQRVVVTVAVILALTNRRDRRGEAGVAEAERVRAAVRARLLGWQPAGATDPVTYAGGRFLFLGDRTIWWQDDYQTAIWIRRTMACPQTN